LDSTNLDSAWRTYLNEKLGYSPEEAAAVSGIGRTRIFSAIGSGELLARKFGRRTVILRKDLEAFLHGLPARQTKGGEAS